MVTRREELWCEGDRGEIKTRGECDGDEEEEGDVDPGVKEEREEVRGSVEIDVEGEEGERSGEEGEEGEGGGEGRVPMPRKKERRN